MLEAGSGGPFPRLKALVLSNNGMALDSVEACAALGRLIAKLPVLEALDLSDTGLRCEGFVAFAEGARKAGQADLLPQLKRLDLMHNYEALENADAGGACGRLAAQLATLEALNLSDTGFTDDALLAFVEESLKCGGALLPRLQKLNMTDNFDLLEGQEACDALARMVKRLTTLSKLLLTGTSFRGRGEAAFQSARVLAKQLDKGLTWDDDLDETTSAWDTAGESLPDDDSDGDL